MSLSQSKFLSLFRAFLCYCRTFLQSTGVTRRWVSSWLKLTDWSTCLQTHPATTRDRPRAAHSKHSSCETVSEWIHSIRNAPDMNFCIWANLKGMYSSAAPGHLQDVLSEPQNFSCENEVQRVYIGYGFMVHPWSPVSMRVFAVNIQHCIKGLLHYKNNIAMPFWFTFIVLVMLHWLSLKWNVHSEELAVI